MFKVTGGETVRTFTHSTRGRARWFWSDFDCKTMAWCQQYVHHLQPCFAAKRIFDTRCFFQHLFHGFITLLAACCVVPHHFPVLFGFWYFSFAATQLQTWRDLANACAKLLNFCENKVLQTARVTTQFYTEWIHLLADRCFCTTCVTCFCAAISTCVFLHILQACFAATHRAVHHFSQGMILNDFAVLQQPARVFLAMKDFSQQTLQQIWVFWQLVWQQRQSQSICNRFSAKTEAVQFFAQLYISTVCICRHLQAFAYKFEGQCSAVVFFVSN